MDKKQFETRIKKIADEFREREKRDLLREVSAKLTGRRPTLREAVVSALAAGQEKTATEVIVGAKRTLPSTKEGAVRVTLSLLVREGTVRVGGSHRDRRYSLVTRPKRIT